MNKNKLKMYEKMHKIIGTIDKYIVPFFLIVGSFMVIGCGLTLVFNELLLYKALNVGILGYIFLCVGVGGSYLLSDAKEYLDKKMTNYRIKNNMRDAIDSLDIEYQKVLGENKYKFKHEPNNGKIIQFDNNYKHTKKYHR